MDLNRLLRARAAKRLEAVEARRRLQMSGKLAPKDMSKEEWKLILEMDSLMTES